MIRTISALLAVAVLASACGNTPQDRGITGAGIGAAGGAIIGALTPLSVFHGALIGAAVGGITGAVTDKSSVNLGDPVWARGDGQASTGASSQGAYDNGVVRRIQSSLAQRGYDPGPVDGRAGPRTRAAIGAYQRDHGLFVDSSPTPELAKHLDTNS
jgi:peptidoglycan hydrolase-like protein with peptidoglycan-binding domain